MSDDATLRVERAGADGAIAVLTLDRPSVRNAIDSAMLEALDTALGGLAGDDTVRAVVLTGAGQSAFSAGMDLRERAAMTGEALSSQRRRLISVVAYLHRFPKPTIAAVEGFALAGGFELALACDLVVASREARFGLPETRVGIFPGAGGTHTLTWRIGPARTADLIFTGRHLPAHEAASWGIVARLTEPGAALGGALDLAATIAEGAPLGIRQAKAAIRHATASLGAALDEVETLYEDVLRSEDRVEGFRAFTEKRKPRFTGR